MKTLRIVSRAAATRAGRNHPLQHGAVSTCNRPAQVRLYSETSIDKPIEGPRDLPNPLEKESSNPSTKGPSTSTSPVDAGAIGTVTASTATSGLGATSGVNTGDTSIVPPNRQLRTFMKKFTRSHPVSSDGFRELMRHVSHPVVIVTSLSWPRHEAWTKYAPPDGSLSEAMPLQETLKDESQEPNHNVENTSTSATQVDLSSSKDVAAEELSTSQESTTPWPVPRAMTISSFSSLSLKPTPSVMFNISLPSHTYGAIASSRRFNVHVLADNHAGARLAHHFSQGQSHLKPEIDGELLKLAGKFQADMQWRKQVADMKQGKRKGGWAPVSRDAVPRIRDSGVLYTLRCIVRLSHNTDSGKSWNRGLIRIDNHSAIVVGNIEDVVYEDVDSDGHPPSENTVALSYANKQYRSTGEPLDPL
ncbi:flavin reductase like domain-containing protein [Truncatella angustata]|uniref:Flavin reductase like domain-containing protein n=1 Tax=Truncatella angustata TaxID=152316 RepID=A0A9P8ZV89_9PEZI|nr:flavin reductase like domain-containing protein [Truncatella angustata]KAH6652379.1 flavin reductase like domain-containing protein [Truncatella angustata]